MTRTAELASDLRVSVMRFARRLKAERGDYPMSPSQIAVLGTLERHGPMSPGAVAEHERVQPPSMTRTLAALEELGYVRREPHPSDRRQQVVSVTDAARELLREDRRRRDAWLAQRLAELTREERAVLAQAAPVLAKIAASGA